MYWTFPALRRAWWCAGAQDPVPRPALPRARPRPADVRSVRSPAAARFRASYRLPYGTSDRWQERAVVRRRMPHGEPPPEAGPLGVVRRGAGGAVAAAQAGEAGAVAEPDLRRPGLPVRARCLVRPERVSAGARGAAGR
ncbi:hypothetical protein GCM10010238_38900 [Streptomyces griseoviridis]|uniref:Uncharacterized protein n=1 Tax=Streptomyces griseoviridis TaxID=45398 RepID=A0A918GLG5_STRGD|nr:hypothetical protein GCM10010238_38900 [Streptomyces niveoruber]